MKPLDEQFASLCESCADRSSLHILRHSYGSQLINVGGRCP